MSFGLPLGRSRMQLSSVLPVGRFPVPLSFLPSSSHSLFVCLMFLSVRGHNSPHIASAGVSCMCMLGPRSNHMDAQMNIVTILAQGATHAPMRPRRPFPDRRIKLEAKRDSIAAGRIGMPTWLKSCAGGYAAPNAPDLLRTSKVSGGVQRCAPNAFISQSNKPA